MKNDPRGSIRKVRVFVAMAMLVATPVVRAQIPTLTPSAADPVCVVAFVDIDPRQADLVLALLRAYGDASRRALGARRFEVLRELARPNHFTLLETWDNEATRQAYGVSDATKQFRARLQPLLASPFDERLSHPEPF